MISTPSASRPRFNIRSLFVSDIHLGSKYTQAGEFLQYLCRYSPEELYLVGDFLDGWKLRRKWRWPAVCSRILERLAELYRKGTAIYYTPGNHDEFLRVDPFIQAFAGHFGKVQIDDEFLHTTVEGKRLLVIHGDRFDCVENHARWLSHLASRAYDLLLGTNRFISRLRKTPGSPYQFCSRVKKRVKCGVRFLSDFENNLLSYTRSKNCDGVICGHIHTPGIWNKEGLEYFNTGDWVEHCTGLVENFDGTIQLDHFHEMSIVDTSASAEYLIQENPEFISTEMLNRVNG